MGQPGGLSIVLWCFGALVLWCCGAWWSPFQLCVDLDLSKSVGSFTLRCWKLARSMCGAFGWVAEGSATFVSAFLRTF